MTNNFRQMNFNSEKLEDIISQADSDFDLSYGISINDLTTSIESDSQKLIGDGSERDNDIVRFNFELFDTHLDKKMGNLQLILTDSDQILELEKLEDNLRVQSAAQQELFKKIKVMISNNKLYDSLFEKEDEIMNNSKIFNKEISMEKFYTNFDETRSKILEKLQLAQDIFKEKMLEKSSTEIFDNASKILYVGDALFELEGFVEDFTTDEYRERMYSYDKQMAALFERFYMDSPQDSSETFILAAENSYYKTDENYEIGSDDKSYFMENYIADYFELKPYLEAFESKTKTSKSIEKIAETSDSIKIKGM